MSSWPLNGKKGGNRKHSKIDTLPPEMKATVEEMIMDGSATYSDIVTYLEQQGYSLSVSSVCRYAQGYVENLQTLQIAQANFRNMLDELVTARRTLILGLRTVWTISQMIWGRVCLISSMTLRVPVGFWAPPLPESAL